MKKILLFSLLCCILSYSAAAECFWNDLPLQKAEKDPGISLKNEPNLLKHKFLTEDLSAQYPKISKVRMIQDHLIVHFGGWFNMAGVINVYDMSGNFLYGYFLRFANGNGGFNINYYDGDILVYVDASRCVYRLSKNGEKVQYYYAEDRDLYMDSPTLLVPEEFPTITTYYHGLLEIADPEGNIVTIADFQKEYEKEVHDTYLYNSIILVLVIVVPITIIVIDCRKLSTKPKRRKKQL